MCVCVCKSPSNRTICLPVRLVNRPLITSKSGTSLFLPSSLSSSSFLSCLPSSRPRPFSPPLTPFRHHWAGSSSTVQVEKHEGLTSRMTAGVFACARRCEEERRAMNLTYRSFLPLSVFLALSRHHLFLALSLSFCLLIHLFLCLSSSIYFWRPFQCLCQTAEVEHEGTGLRTFLSNTARRSGVCVCVDTTAIIQTREEGFLSGSALAAYLLLSSLQH